MNKKLDVAMKGLLNIAVWWPQLAAAQVSLEVRDKIKAMPDENCGSCRIYSPHNERCDAIYGRAIYVPKDFGCKYWEANK